MAPDVVTVYEYELFDSRKRYWRRTGRMGTLDAITRVGGVPVRSTALPVDASRIDAEGFVIAPSRPQ